MSHPATTAQIAITIQRARLFVGWGVREAVGASVMAGLYRWGGGRSSWLLAALLVAGLMGRPSPAVAQASADPDARRLDLYRGPLLTTSRITGLAGASAGVGVGIDGVLRNPASLANRSESSTDWFAVDIAFDVLRTPGSRIDFDADGTTTDADTDVEALNVGLGLLFDKLAVGFFISSLSYGDPALSIAYFDAFLGAAYALDDGGLILGAGFNIRGLTVTTLDASGANAGEEALSGGTFALGALVRPRGLSWRFGGQVRFGTDLEPVSSSAPRTLDAAVAPWQIALGVSHFWGADPRREYNAPLRSAVLQSLRPGRLLDRRYFMVSSDLVLAGPTPAAFNVEGYVSGDPKRSGEDISASVHLGAEGEVINHRLRARLGTYLEPNRVSAGPNVRVHLTGGIEVRLFEVLGLNLKATFAYDIARDFENLLFGVGFWN